jgi:hypothetical protein
MKYKQYHMTRIVKIIYRKGFHFCITDNGKAYFVESLDLIANTLTVRLNRV